MSYSFDRPFVIRSNGEFGSCVADWSVDFFLEHSPDLRISIHEAMDPFFNYSTKSFEYKISSFHGFLRDLKVPRDSSSPYLYYRSLHTKVKKPASLDIYGDTISSGFSLPQKLLPEGAEVHSTVMRVGSSGLSVWMHYDILDNFLLQITGNKKILLYNPDRVNDLKIKGSSSEIPTRDLFDPALRPEGCIEFNLSHGDVVFIPALWLHATQTDDCLGPANISVNCFFKRKDFEKFYAAKDIWANKDFELMESAENTITRIKEEIPDPYRKFYLLKLQGMISQMLSNS
jgi:tRNA wybutosine-synthesizing protein 5